MQVIPDQVTFVNVCLGPLTRLKRALILDRKGFDGAPTDDRLSRQWPGRGSSRDRAPTTTELTHERACRATVAG